MPTPTAPVDKARQQLIAKFDKAMKDVAEALKCFTLDQDKADFIKESKALQAKADEAARDTSPAGAKALMALTKKAEAMPETIRQRSYAMFAKHRRVELKGQVGGALAGALLEVGKISDPILTRLMFAEQAKLKARMDKAEKAKVDIEAVDSMGDIDDEMPALMQRIKAAQGVSGWLAATYKPMLAQLDAGLKLVDNDLCRRVVRAEIDFVEDSKNGALAKLDPKAVESATLPHLRRIARVTARLAKLGQRKSPAWPTARNFDDLEKALEALDKAAVPA